MSGRLDWDRAASRDAVRRPEQLAPTDRQLQLLADLAKQLGHEPSLPLTRGEASADIQRLLEVRRVRLRRRHAA